MLNLRENIKGLHLKSTSNWNKYECIVLDPEKQNQEIKYT
jgi:hypothetical protein